MTALTYFHARPFGPFLKDVSQLLDEGMRASGRVTSVPSSILESDLSYTLTVEAPGLGKDDLAIQVEENQLVISGEKKAPENLNDDGHYLVNERSFGKFSRAFRLSDSVDQEKIEAGFENGVLTVILPKLAKVPPRSVEISGTTPEASPVEVKDSESKEIDA